MSKPEPPPGMERFETPTGTLLVHAKSRCSGACPIHGPSDHPMKDMELHWREDRKIFERICPHGIGHPDPDTLSFIERTSGKYYSELEAVHGCDGCCQDPRTAN